jgi:hypothetical protein
MESGSQKKGILMSTQINQMSAQNHHLFSIAYLTFSRVTYIMALTCP